MSASDKPPDRLKRELAENARLREEVERLRRENARLRQSIQTSNNRAEFEGAGGIDVEAISIDKYSPPDVKVALFRRLFRGREDVYARRWTRADGTSGYSPARRRGWRQRRSGLPKDRATPEDDLLPLTDEEIRAHLQGSQTVGIFPLLTDDTCWFLAVDLDKSTWQEDALALLSKCDQYEVSAHLERSRSGSGAHVWVFFSEAVPAALARNLGSALLSRAMAQRYQLGLASYDRLFPNQDTLPKGGFGNLIALPLQKGPRGAGNTVFITRELEPHGDQWSYLAGVRRMSRLDVEAIVRRLTRDVDILAGIRGASTDDEAPDPWTLPPSRRIPERAIRDPMPAALQVVRADQLYIPKSPLPPAMIDRLLRLAAFQNPEFYKAQAMRLSTFDKPRIIACGEDLANHVGLPRGCEDDAVALLESHGVEVEVKDQRSVGLPFKARFLGQLSPTQKQALDAMCRHEIGVLAAATAFGKTVVAAKLIAQRRVNTLVVVHRRDLVEQWRARLIEFLDVPARDVGRIGGGRSKRTGIIDIATIQSLVRKGEVKDFIADYGQVIVDECHHIPAFSCEQVMRRAKARFVLGLTATPARRDGHHPILFMQCGPIRFHISGKDQAHARGFELELLTHVTQFALSPGAEESSIQDIFGLLITDCSRNQLIAQHIAQAVELGRTPLVLSERLEHLELLKGLLENRVQHIITLHGRMGRKQRAQAFARLAEMKRDDKWLLLSTGRYIGEGFDDARLDTLFLTFPISFRGTLQQYAGRLHRERTDKVKVQIHDFVDVSVPVLMRMYQRRASGYRSMGYAVERQPCSSRAEDELALEP